MLMPLIVRGFQKAERYFWGLPAIISFTFTVSSPTVIMVTFFPPLRGSWTISSSTIRTHHTLNNHKGSSSSGTAPFTAHWSVLFKGNPLSVCRLLFSLSPLHSCWCWRSEWMNSMWHGKEKRNILRWFTLFCGINT